MKENPAELQQQIEVSKMLGRGFAFSLIWLGGIGSLAAVVIGLRARSIILKSNNEISGLRMAWWCIIVGVIGTLLVIPIMIQALMGIGG